ncbi:DUF871 domain-containing protein [Clostridium algidicarnis]|uniref:Outer surface protein n=2 Tax=Clostridium algidicarnis TaxID=37659 RepID=A0A2S6FVE4_9CLOT|nr:MupG family TIM beta-alpha barrel fold protein [Clostridium algidicarnis]MBU3220001.1 DUF871 family protein [Clostridium algidicarnis]MCB2287090.1 MupG family TIM beta-alpha barrel fold protein [Clostridium algidicarnis]PPK46332.1 hypothetical protein BD821_11733 [Clostridium algidicarnis DSM 15099]
MKNIGFSIYPAHTKLEDNLKYIDKANKYGYKRIFTCLLSVEGDKKKIMDEFKQTIAHANKYGMKVIADINPEVLKYLGVSFEDLGIFKEMGLYGIRLDNGFSGMEESVMSFNKYGLKIEFNMSSGTKYIDNVFSYNPNPENILGCHNFYPHKYSGIGYEHFTKCNAQFKNYNIRTAAFVSSNKAKYGPWPVSEGLCTLEEHRNLPIQVQAKHLFSTNSIDDVIIANAFASEEELKALSEVNPYILTFKANIEEGISDAEKNIILETLHSNRADVSEYMIRSSRTRVKSAGDGFRPFNTKDIKRGDITIDNVNYKNYTGELQIALKDMKNSGNTNVVGRIDEDEIFLIDYVKPLQKFLITE